MKMTEEVQRTGLPSLLQIQYLMELERIGWKRGAVMEIAEKCGVSHPAVSRYLKSCCEKGILNEKYEFTVTGKMMLERYRKLLDETEKYLARIGVEEEAQKETLKRLIENLDCATLGRIVRSDRSPLQHTKEPLVWKEESFLDDVLEWGSWPVCITIYQAGSGTEQMRRRSMADRGFERQAILRHNKRGNWLGLSSPSSIVYPFSLRLLLIKKGAGDTFCASSLNYVLEHDLNHLTEENLKELLTFANAAASLITTKKGALKVMPEKEEVLAFIASRS